MRADLNPVAQLVPRQRKWFRRGLRQPVRARIVTRTAQTPPAQPYRFEKADGAVSSDGLSTSDTSIETWSDCVAHVSQRAHAHKKTPVSNLSRGQRNIARVGVLVVVGGLGGLGVRAARKRLKASRVVGRAAIVDSWRHGQWRQRLNRQTVGVRIHVTIQLCFYTLAASHIIKTHAPRCPPMPPSKWTTLLRLWSCPMQPSPI